MTAQQQKTALQKFSTSSPTDGLSAAQSSFQTAVYVHEGCTTGGNAAPRVTESQECEFVWPLTPCSHIILSNVVGRGFGRLFSLRNPTNK
jgi:hypothetical protein